MSRTPQQAGPFKPGDLVLNKYEVRGLLGVGGYAFVYDCYNPFLEQEVAIKVIPNPQLRGDHVFQRARKEAQLLYTLDHPGIVRVMDAGEIDGMPYLVMEKLRGRSLREHLRRHRRLRPFEALHIAAQAAEALEAAHAQQVIHRDLKPDNMFILWPTPAARQLRVKVLDFGIAKFREGYLTTKKDQIQGTYPYMSPEQVQGLGVTFASDVFQLGIILYEMMAGIVPCMIGVEDPLPQTLVMIQCTTMPPRLNTMVQGLPDHVDRLVWRAIAKAPQQRFATMREFTDTIQASLERLQKELRPDELVLRAPDPEEARQPAHRESRPNIDPKTTPVALVTSQPMKAAAALEVMDTAPQSRPPDAAQSAPPQVTEPLPAAGAVHRGNVRLVQQAQSDRALVASAEPPLRRSPSGRALAEAAAQPIREATPSRVRAAARPDAKLTQKAFFRAAVVGLALAVPAGIYVGLSKRAHAVATTEGPALGSPAIAQPAASAPPATAPQPVPVASVAPVAPEVSPATSAVAPPSVELVPRAAGQAAPLPEKPAIVNAAAPQTDARPSKPQPAKLAGSQQGGLPSSGLDAPPQAKPAKTAAPDPQPASSLPYKKLIF